MKMAPRSVLDCPPSIHCSLPPSPSPPLHRPPTTAQAMVEIYLNPENETNWDDLELDKRQELPEPLRAAEKLLHELPRSPRQQARAAPRRALPAATPACAPSLRPHHDPLPVSA